MARISPVNARKLTAAGQKARDTAHRGASAAALHALMAHTSAAGAYVPAGDWPGVCQQVRDGQPVLGALGRNAGLHGQGTANP